MKKLVLLITLTIIIASCGYSPNDDYQEKRKHMKCDTKFNEAFFTTVDLSLNSDDYILVKSYVENQNFKTLLKSENMKIRFKSYDKQYKRWSFDLVEDLDAKFDYQFFFRTLIDTIKFDLSEIEIAVVDFHTEQEVVYACAVCRWKVDGKLKGEGNITFEK